MARYLHELVEGIRYVHNNRKVRLLGMAWALFIAAMMTQGVTSAPLSDRVLHRGAVGYGWINAGWASGAFVSMLYASRLIRRYGANRSVTATMAVIAVSVFVLPEIRWIIVTVPIYFVMGSGRGVGGIAIQSEMMEMVREHFDAGTGTLPMTLEEAKEHREKLMQERGAFVKVAEAGWQRHSYSFCEH